MTTERKEWTLTSEALDGLLRFLDPDPDKAGREYECIRQRLMQLFRWRGCLSFEDYADQTIDRVARRLAEGLEVNTTNPYALFYGVAKNVLLEHWRKAERESHAEARLTRTEFSANPEEITASKEQERLSEIRRSCVQGCLQNLPSQSLTLIRTYYAEGEILNKEQRKQLADALSISVNTLRVRAFRVRVDVEKCARECVGRADQQVTLSQN